MSKDTRAVTEGLGQALDDSGLTQAEFASALGTSASRFSTYRSGKTMPTAAFYLRALRVAKALKAAREGGYMTPQSTAREVKKSLQKHDALRALKMALQARDHLRLLLHEESGTTATEAWTTTPRPTGDPRWDAFIAALAEHEFTAADRRPPAWTATTAPADNGEPLILKSLLLTEDEVRASTPDWLARHGIYATERDLVTA